MNIAMEMGEKTWRLLFSSGNVKRNGRLRVYQRGVDGSNYMDVRETVLKAIERHYHPMENPVLRIEKRRFTWEEQRL